MIPFSLRFGGTKRRWLLSGLLTAASVFGCSAQAQQTTNLYTTAWMGNTHANGITHVLQNIDDIAVAPDGTVFTDVVWDEGDAECTQFNSNGTINRPANWTHGWGPTGGQAVACNSNYVFIAENMDYVASLTGSQLSLEVFVGRVGSNYRIQTSSDLANWTDIITTNWASFPSHFIDSSPTLKAKYYRTQAAP